MSVDSFLDAAGNLLIITVINAVIVFGLTFSCLCIRDSLAQRKRILAKSKRE